MWLIVIKNNHLCVLDRQFVSILRHLGVPGLHLGMKVRYLSVLGRPLRIKLNQLGVRPVEVVVHRVGPPHRVGLV